MGQRARWRQAQMQVSGAAVLWATLTAVDVKRALSGHYWLLTAAEHLLS
eukprot:SAG22_NODE_16317_length_328_cov_0.672489_2_plen_49_part_01